MYLKFFKLLTKFTFSLILILIASEVLISKFIPEKLDYTCINSNFDIPNALKPNCITKREFHKVFFYKIKINEKGLRSNNIVEYKKPINTFRILILGDSITFGLGVNNENLFSFILEKNLNQQIPKQSFEVLNASSPGWGPVEYYLFMKNEGYKYSPDLVIISQSIDDSTLIPEDRVDFKNLKYELISPNSAHLFFDKVFTRQQKASIYQLIKQGITSSSVYDSFLHNSHIFELVNKRLAQYDFEQKKKIMHKTAFYQFLENLKSKNISEIHWDIQGKEFKGPISTKTQKQIQYYFIMEALLHLISKNNSKVVFLNLPTYQEIFNIVEKIEPLYPIKDNIRSIHLLEGILKFHKKNVTPLLFPKDLHWTPSGHHLAAALVFNYLLTENLVPNLMQEKHKLDLDDPQLVNKIKSANKSLNKDLNKTPLWFFNKAMIYKNQNQNRLAIETLKKYLNQYSKDKYGWLELGKLQSKENEKLKAIESFHKSLDYSQKPSPMVLFLIGKNYFELKQFEKSLKYLTKSSQYKHLVLPEVYNYLAIISHRKKNFGMAEKYWKLAISEKPDFPHYHRSLGNLYFDSQFYEKAVTEYKKSIELDPTQPRVLILMGLAYSKLNKLEEAAKALSMALKFEPNNQIALSGLNFINTFKKK